MKIGEFASKAGVNIQTVRYYERRNVLSPSSVSDSGYRHYDVQDLKRLHFIKQTQELGFTLSEIEELLSLKSKPATSCRSVQAKAKRRLADVQKKKKMLCRIEAALKDVVTTCSQSEQAVECPFLERLDF